MAFSSRFIRIICDNKLIVLHILQNATDFSTLWQTFLANFLYFHTCTINRRMLNLIYYLVLTREFYITNKIKINYWQNTSRETVINQILVKACNEFRFRVNIRPSLNSAITYDIHTRQVCKFTVFVNTTNLHRIVMAN